MGQTSRPNILLLHVDQHRYDCVGANGHPFVRTPALDGLAAQGMNFSQAFCPSPVCVPSRNSMLFGVWPTGHLAIANAGTEAPRPALDGLQSFSAALRAGGYHLAVVGKWQIHPQRGPTEYGFNEYISEKGYAAWRAGQGLPPRPFHGWFGEPDPGVAPDQSRLGWSADHVIGMLRERAAAGGPFFLRWDTEEPHLPNIVPEPYASMYAPSQVAPWPSFPDPLAGKPYIQGQQRRTWGLEDRTWEQWQPTVARYLGEVSLIDHQVGRILAALDELGLAQNTFVVYTADHGDLCGGHGMIDKHYVMYEDVVRVPFIVRWPGHVAPHSRCDAFVSHGLDLARTFCELGEVPVPASFCGESLLPLLEQTGGNGRQDIFATYHGNQFGLYSQRMVRDSRWKYVWNATAEDELYDLARDPGEVINLARDRSCAAELSRLRVRMVDWLERTADPLLNGWNRDQLLKNLSI